VPAAGYSGTPLARKLGIKEDAHLLHVNAPKELFKLLAPLPASVTLDKKLSERTDIVHVFVTRKSDLAKRLASYRKAIRSDAAVWVSWPKKSSGVETDTTEDTIRDVALPMGFVDVKVCAVSEVWSGLKLVIRKTLR
jgi:Protein of unknown function (DUF3052)